MSDAPRHTLLDDAQGLGFGSLMAAFGMHLLLSAGLVTGQTAGMAVLISYATGWAFGPVFFVVNIPFYWLGYRRFGLAFTIKTFIAVALLTLFTSFIPGLIPLGAIQPGATAVIFGCITGAGLLALFRHGASLGGIGILALLIQDHTGFRAGWTQLAFDAVMFGLAFTLVPAQIVGWSFLGALVLNLTLAINHRRDRYIAT
ncbi:YitT family protein [Frigidibacter sp. ROC022]|uniref:YitT family protein n=1 Tax=Frigidibacter sp. ROC022 TaxID=2971796 RepID=UPI00215A7D01|nr:YitT family protein [Frigidibacter sp. ROC022]MCR8726307.1 YitT family protein [Frigidibacter sp. ROC022]